MSGFFGVTSKQNCVFDVFFGTDYHSHLGTKRGGMAIFNGHEIERSIHNITNSPFRTKFENDVEEFHGNMGIGCISDNEPQPLNIRSHHGTYSITTVGRINNMAELEEKAFHDGVTHFLEMSSGEINPTELVAALINQRASIPEGIRYVQSLIDGSMSMLILTPKGIYAARDRLGRTPVVIGKKEDAFCASFESFAYLNLGYRDHHQLGPGEIVFITPDGMEQVSPPLPDMKICTFMWVYYGYVTSCYEGLNVEVMRNRCGAMLAERDDVEADCVAGVPDSGTPHAIGYANASGIPFQRPFIKYTPTWPRSFMPQHQSQRNLIAHMKLIAIESLIRDKRLILIDDSLVRGTQMRETTEFLFDSGAREVHIRLACPPPMFACRYLNFSRSTSIMDLISRRKIALLEGDADKNLEKYTDPDTPEYAAMVEEIRKELKFTSLKYTRLDDLVASTGLPAEKLCTYCWTGKE